MRLSHILGFYTISFFAVVGGLIYALLALFNSYQAHEVCRTHSMEWARMSDNVSGAMNDPKQHPYFATQLARMQLACGDNGRVLAPAAIIALSTSPAIIDQAKASLNIKP